MATKIMNGLDLQSQKITNLGSPSASSDAANKSYVDGVVNGLSWKAAVRAATTTNGALATAYANGQVIDGVTLATGDRILLKDQTTGSENGIYTVNASGAPTRTADGQTATWGMNATVFVQEGTVNADKAFTCTNNGTITIGTTALTFAQVGGGSAYTAGNGLQLAGSTFSVLLDTNSGLAASGTGLKVDSTVARKYAGTVGDGTSTAITVTHNLGTRDVVVSVHDAATFDEVRPDINKATTNTVVLTFATAPASNSYRVVVIGA